LRLVEQVFREKNSDLRFCFPPIRQVGASMFLRLSNSVEDGTRGLLDSKSLALQIKTIASRKLPVRVTNLTRRPEVGVVVISVLDQKISFCPPETIPLSRALRLENFQYDIATAPINDIITQWFSQIPLLSYKEHIRNLTGEQQGSMAKTKARMQFAIIEQIFEPAGLEVSFCSRDNGNRIIIGHRQCVYRVCSGGKYGIYETRMCWWRNKQTIPYSDTDEIDFFITAVVENGSAIGMFIMSKDLMREKGYLTTSDQEGKVAMRLLPPFAKVTNPTGIKNQLWQAPFYVDLTGSKDEAIEKTERIFRREMSMS